MQYSEWIQAEFRISQYIEYEILVKAPFRICVEFGVNLMQNSTFFNEALFGMDDGRRSLPIYDLRFVNNVRVMQIFSDH